MFKFMKVPPTTYVLQYKHGKIKREGAGLSFFYWAPTSTIVAVPLASADVPFVFLETTADFQSVTIQGQLTYRVADPKRLASLLDFTIDKQDKSYFEDHSRDRQITAGTSGAYSPVVDASGCATPLPQGDAG